MTRDRAEIVRRAYAAFRADLDGTPPITLRGGDRLDSYAEPPSFDPELDEPTDAYLETFAFNGLNFLDPPSWRHYLPSLIDYALRNIASNAPGTMAIDGLLWSLRPPDRDPPRLASLTPEQEQVIVAALDELAFAEDSVYKDDALQVLEEWWIPGALYRPKRGAE
ncbi:MAG TPA: DUF6714 family protein [Gemmatimonadaceae bacterium]|nr:DUF6714 family protein [Gemmatimonadaceae bacterium]